MTTIAWDGTTLAADTLLMSSGLRTYTNKLFVLPGCIYGGCGSSEDIADIREWLAGGGSRPTLSEGGGWGLVVSWRYPAQNGVFGPRPGVFHVSGKRPTLTPVMPAVDAAIGMADGSGRDYAITAMHMGKSAVQAVELASRFDIGTGGAIDSYKIRILDGHAVVAVMKDGRLIDVEP